MSNKNKLLLGVLLVLAGPLALAGVPNSAVGVPQSIPAISQAGLIGLAFIVGIIGARLINKLKTAAR